MTNFVTGIESIRFFDIRRNFEALSTKDGVAKIHQPIIASQKKMLTKVNVVFGNAASIVIPISNDMLVSDLIASAQLRLQKLNLYGSNNHRRPLVKYLRSAANGGILFDGDRLAQVIDDREQLIAITDDDDQPFCVLTSVGDSTNKEFQCGQRRPSLSEITNSGNVCRIKIGDTLQHDNRPSIDNLIEVTNFKHIPSNNSSLVVRKDSDRSNVSMTENSLKFGKQKSALKSTNIPSKLSTMESPAKSVVRWQDNRALNTTADSPILPPRFKRDGIRKSHITDEMLDFAARLAEKSLTSNCYDDTDFENQHNATPIKFSPTETPSTSKRYDAPNVLESELSNAVSNSSRAPLLSELQRGNTRKLGKILRVQLTKSKHGGLGFTVASRDNAVQGNNFTCIKNILPNGSAILDGRLKEGDRLLQINDVDVSNFSKDQIVTMLRQIKEGQEVTLNVSRQGGSFDTIDKPDSSLMASSSLLLPRHIPSPDPDPIPIRDTERCKQRLVFDIALNESGSAGLGVSVKGRTKKISPDRSNYYQSDVCSTSGESLENSCGIFVKLIIKGGAADKDGRLRVNDQLLSVEDVDLTGLTNKQAMETLRQVMQQLDPSTSSIRLIVARWSSLYFNDVSQPAITSTPQTLAARLSTRRRLQTNYVSNYLSYNESQALPSPGGSSLTTPGTPDGAASLTLETPRPVPSVHLNIPDYGDYATIVKGCQKPIVQSSEICQKSIDFTNDFQSSTVDSRRRSSIPTDLSEPSTADESTVATNPFVRESVGRQSMSEKRRGAAKLDPSSTTTYMQIMHQRQTSAPTIARKNRRDLSIDNSTITRRSSRGPFIESDIKFQQRLSQSMESVVQSQQMNPINSSSTVTGETYSKVVKSSDNETSHVSALARDKRSQRPLLHEIVARNAMDDVASSLSQRRRSGNDDRRRLTTAASRHTYHENRPTFDMFDGCRPEVFPNTGSPNGMTRSKTTEFHPPNSFANRQKQQRKSSSNGFASLKNLFRFGSAGKSSKKLSLLNDGSIVDQTTNRRQTADPEMIEISRQKAFEEQRRIRMYYDSFRNQLPSTFVNPLYGPRCFFAGSPQSKSIYAPHVTNQYQSDWYYPSGERLILDQFCDPRYTYYNSLDRSHLRQKINRIQGGKKLNSSEENSPPADPFEPKPDYPANNNNNGSTLTHSAQRTTSVHDEFQAKNHDKSLNQESALPPIPPPDYEEYLRSIGASGKNFNGFNVGYGRSPIVANSNRLQSGIYCSSGSPGQTRRFYDDESPYVTKIHF